MDKTKPLNKGFAVADGKGGLVLFNGIKGTAIFIA